MGRKKGVAEFEETAPDDFDPENPYKDPVAMLEMKEHIVREKWIDIEKAKILRERLRWCYRIEGINHLQKCRHLVQQYLDSTRGIGWGKDHRPPSLHGTFDFDRETNNNTNNSLSNNSTSPTPLKINKESHMIKKPSFLSFSSSFPSSSLSSSSVSSLQGATSPTKTQQKCHRPVIIYTHSPKIIHTNPRDFKSLVQRLTGKPESEDDKKGNVNDVVEDKKHGGGGGAYLCNDYHHYRSNDQNLKMVNTNDDNDSSSSVITTDIHENHVYGKINGDLSCFDPSVFDLSNPYLSNHLPIFTPSTTTSADQFLCVNKQPFFSFIGADSLLFNGDTNMRSSNALEGIKEFHEY